MINIKDVLEKSLIPFSLSCSARQIDMFNVYADMIIQWNKKINLTAILEPNEMAIKHFADSISLLSYVDIKKNASVIDVGTGAGFPGIPLKIMRDDINLTLLDSLNKRINFLNEVIHSLNITAETIHKRAEEGGQNVNMREKFDVAVSRAVAPLNVLTEYCLPYVKKGGMFIAMKGPNALNEVENSNKAISILGGKIEKIEEFTVGENNSRTLIIIKKVKNTGNDYPRHGSKISKNPL